MSDSGDDAPYGHCALCGEVTATDAPRTGIRAGRLLCANCAVREVIYTAECIHCEWTHTCAGPAHQWYHLRQNAQQAANTHEKEMYHFEDERHLTAWRYLGTGDDTD